MAFNHQAEPARAIEDFSRAIALDNRLAPAEKRTWKVDLPLPSESAGARLEITALHGRLTVVNARHMRTVSIEPFERFLPGGGKMLAEMESHYPFFSWVHREEIDLDSGERTRASREELIRESRKAAKMSLEQIEELMKEKGD